MAVGDDLRDEDLDGIGEVDVVARDGGLENDLPRAVYVLIDADQEINHQLHVEHTVVSAARDLVEKHVVGDRHHAVVEGAQFDRAEPDRQDVAILPCEGHPVAHLEWAVEHDRHAGHE